MWKLNQLDSLNVWKSNSKRQAVIEGFLRTFAFTKAGGGGEVGKLKISETGYLMHELAWRALIKGRGDMLAASTPDSWFRVTLNGVSLQLPKYTLMTMRHCLTASTDRTISLNVETAHWEKIREQLTQNSHFLDIGAATGAMSVPFALSLGGGIRFSAFEPSLRARSYLEETAKRNGISNVQIFPFALSDAAGELEFVELPEDESGLYPFLPEASRLAIEGDTLCYPGQISYKVSVTTLDAIAQELGLNEDKKLVIKIDVEGFEANVLQGGLGVLRRFKPFLSIDIHFRPSSNEIFTDADCIGVLAPLGYRIERLAHVMLAYPQ